MSWAPYLSNLFQIDYKDAQDACTEFHYSWLFTLIDFMGWRELEYVVFSTTPQLGGAIYRILRAGPLANQKKENEIVFEAYPREIQESIDRAWRITPEAVARYGDIGNFWARKKVMWIQPRKDLDKQWL